MRFVLALLALLLSAAPSHAVIVSGGGGAPSLAYDNNSAIAAGTGNLSWTHIPIGTPPKGVVCYVIQYNSGADQVSGVTYGGTAMAEVTGSPLLKTAAEAMAVYGYFLGSSVPTGNQTVAVTVTGAASKRAMCLTVTSGGDTEVVDTTTISSNSVANPSGTLTTGVLTFASFGGISGSDSYSITVLDNWTRVNSSDFGTEILELDRYDLIQSSDVTFGWTAAAEDAVILGIAIGVAQPADSTPPYTASFSPPNEQTGVSPDTTEAVFHVLDDGDGVDNTTIQVTRTGGVLQTCGDNLVCTGGVGDITVTYPGLSLAYDDNVAFQIAASDLADTPNAMDNTSYWFTVQSDPGAGGNLLVGDNTAGGGSEYIQSTANYTYTSQFTASSSGTATTAWIYFQTADATNCKVDLYAAGDIGVLLDSVIVPVSGVGWKPGTLTGAVPIAAGTAYRLGYTCNAWQRIRTDAVGYANYCATGNYTSPSNPNCKTGLKSGSINVYITD